MRGCARGVCRSWILWLAALGLMALGCETPVLQATVSRAGSDERAAAFQSDWLPRLIVDARENFNPDSIARDFSRLTLDPSGLVLLEATAVRIYFVASQGGFQSSLGYWLEGTDVERPGPYIVFPNATSPRKLFDYADMLKRDTRPSGQYTYGERSPTAPVSPGDFVDLDVLPAGTQIVFFLVADAASGEPKGRFTTILERNPDKVQHVVTVAYQDSPYLLLAFEDLMGGGDKTYNDIVFAVELSQSGIAALSDAKKQREVAALLERRARMKVIRARIALGALAGLAVGGPFFLWALMRYLRRRRMRRALEEAREDLESGNPQDALKRMRNGLRQGGPRSIKKGWTDLQVQACKQLRDAGALHDLFEQQPGSVLKDEAASLMVARAQLETGRSETFQTLRSAWQKQETAPWSWLTLESDLLVEQQKARDAESLLRQRQFDGEHDAVRLARLAELVLSGAPEDAQHYMARALQLAPNEPEVHRSRAQILEHLGRLDEAKEAWYTAVRVSDGDPFHRDHLAEFLVRRADYAGALATWREALPPPTADALWLKAVFWERVAVSAEIPWAALEMPTGPLRPLLERLIEMPEDRFWPDGTTEAIEQQHPELFARPECFWLRTVQALLDRREKTALALLATCPSDNRLYFNTLESAMHQVLTYRRVQFLNPDMSILAPGTPQAWRHSLFQRLDQWAHGEVQKAPKDLVALLMSPDGVYVGLFQAVGWQRAADAFR